MCVSVDNINDVLWSLSVRHNDCVKIVQLATKHNVMIIPFGGKFSYPSRESTRVF